MADKKEADSKAKADAPVKEEVLSDDDGKTKSDKEGVESPTSKTSDKASEQSEKSDKVEEKAAPAKRKKIKLTVKTTTEKHCVEIAENGSAVELKDLVSKACQVPEEQVCLIFSGKIIKDDETLSHHNIKDGNTVHLVVRAPPKAEATNSSTFPFGLENIGGIAGLGNLGIGESDFVQFQQRIQNQIMARPELLRQIMGNTFVQSMMSNPDTIGQLINANPQMRQLIERNPEINQILNNPDALKRTMEVAQNPTMLEELMRNPEVIALAQPHNAQGAQSEPQGATAKEETSSVSKTSDGSKQKSTESNSAASQSDSHVSSTEASQAGESKPSKDEIGSTAFFHEVYSSPEMHGMLRQMIEHPEILKNMLSLPYMKSVLEAMASNPTVATQLLTSNPMMANNQQLREQMRPVIPQIINQLQNPDIHKLITSPDALRALSSIYNGLDQLHQNVPEMFRIFPGMQPPPPTPPQTSGASPAPSSENSEAGAQTAAPQLQQDFSQFMRIMVEALCQSSNDELPPEVRFQNELSQLQTMGFINTEANIQALVDTFGDINAAIERLLRPQL